MFFPLKLAAKTTRKEEEKVKLLLHFICFTNDYMGNKHILLSPTVHWNWQKPLRKYRKKKLLRRMQVKWNYEANDRKLVFRFHIHIVTYYHMQQSLSFILCIKYVLNALLFFFFFVFSFWSLWWLFYADVLYKRISFIMFLYVCVYSWRAFYLFLLHTIKAKWIKRENSLFISPWKYSAYCTAHIVLS